MRDIVPSNSLVEGGRNIYDILAKIPIITHIYVNFRISDQFKVMKNFSRALGAQTNQGAYSVINRPSTGLDTHVCIPSIGREFQSFVHSSRRVGQLQ